MLNLGKFIGKKFNLSERGSRDLNKAIWACVLTNLVLFLPFIIFIQIVNVAVAPLLNGTDPEWGKLWAWFGAGAAACVLYFFVYRYEYKKTYVTSYAESEKNRIAVAERIRKLPMSFFFRRDLAEITTNMMADCTNIEHVLSHVLPQLVSAVITTALMSVLLLFFNWAMALSVLCTLPVSIAIVVLSKKRQTKKNEEFRLAKLDVSAQTQEYIEGIKVIKAFGMDGKKFENLDGSLKKMRKVHTKLELVTGVLVTGATMLLMAGTGITIFTGSLLLTGNSLSFTVFLTFVLISLRIYAPVAGSIALTAELFYFANSTKRMRMLTDEPIMTGDMTELHDFGIEFDHVTFAYNDESVIKDVSCRIEPGSVTAIVGPSGSGKSTMARLIARFFDIQKGKISIGGVDISALDPEYLMRYMSFVFQDVVLFNDTVYNNIKIGNPEASREEILKAAGEAMCDEFANKLPDAYDSVIGENGCTLSGGERQRISIARALLKNAPIILLDEATAALDPENEVSIQDAVTKLIADKTVVVIAHRLRTVSNADKILVLDNGKLTEEGTHSRLMEKGGLYAKMVEIQASSAGFSIAESDCEK